MLELIKKLASIGERQLEGEKKAAEIIKKTLAENSVGFEVQKFMTSVPKYQRWELLIDGKTIKSLPCCFKSGKITSESLKLSSLLSSQLNIDDANINSNEKSDEISRPNHYFAPALAVRRSDFWKVKSSSEVEGFVDVEKTELTSENILVGNLESPKNIVFTHYDSIGPGAIDDATGIAIMMKLVKENPKLLKDNLFVFAGAEELSYDYPVYWGKGYREFEKKYKQALDNCEQIIVIECLGQTKPEVFTDGVIMSKAFPLAGIAKLKNKVKLVAGDYDELMKVYHSEADTPNKIDAELLEEELNVVLDLLKN